MLASVQPQVREAFVLSTCNRTELYAVTGHAGSGADLLLRFLAGESSIPAAELRESCYTHTQDDAARHLLRVASGLDSMVLGEDQIQAQLKRALAAARAAGTLGPVLERLGSAALACGKRVRAFTNIGRHAVSLESLAVRAVTDRLGTLDSRRVLVLGSGESARLIALQLQSTGARLVILSRRPERAAALAARAGAESGSLAELPLRLADADVVVCCTFAPQPVLLRDALPRRPLVCVDLGMPRDVDPAVAGLDGVTLVTLAELSRLAEAHREERRRHIPAAEGIVAAETARFLEWCAARGAASTVAALHDHARRVADAELERTLARLAEASPRDRELVAELAHRIVAKLLHAPADALRAHPEAENIALALRVAFGLPGAAEAFARSLPLIPGDDEPPEHIEDAAS